jgi:hypothetical protein
LLFGLPVLSGTQYKQKLMRLDMLLPILLPGLSGLGPARDWAGVACPPDGRAADPTAAGNGRRSALAGERREISGNHAPEQFLPFFSTLLESTILRVIAKFPISKAGELVLYLVPKTYFS